MCIFEASRAEYNFKQRVYSDRRCKQIKLNSQKLIATASSHPLGIKRIQKVLPHAIKEFGIPTKSGYSFSWNDVPANYIVDTVYGIDCYSMILGNCVGIDVTINPNAVNKKMSKLGALNPIWKQFFDSVGVILVDDINLLTNLDAFKLLKRVKQSKISFISI